MVGDGGGPAEMVIRAERGGETVAGAPPAAGGCSRRFSWRWWRGCLAHLPPPACRFAIGTTGCWKPRDGSRARKVDLPFFYVFLT